MRGLSLIHIKMCIRDRRVTAGMEEMAMMAHTSAVEPIDNGYVVDAMSAYYVSCLLYTSRCV